MKDNKAKRVLIGEYRTCERQYLEACAKLNRIRSRPKGQRDKVQIYGVKAAIGEIRTKMHAIQDQIPVLASTEDPIFMSTLIDMFQERLPEKLFYEVVASAKEKILEDRRVFVNVESGS